MQPQGPLEISADRGLADSAYLHWHETLMNASEPFGRSARQLVGTDIRFRRITRHKKWIHLEFWQGDARSAAVQLNQPHSVGSEHPGTVVGTDRQGRRYILRQGDLHASPSKQRIGAAEFRRRTGLTPVETRIAGRSTNKEWHVVARVDGPTAEAIVRSTAAFVRRCWNARMFGRQAAEDQARLARLFGQPERGGWYDIDPALMPTRVLRIQGYVSECLADILSEFDIELAKPRHAANYEVDGTIDAPRGPLLIEIKTGVTAADVYCGVGQLTIYPVVLGGLDDHAKILLLPGSPTHALTQALRACGVELHRYDLKRGRRTAAATFTAEFLRRCGVSARDVSGLVETGRALP